jgi:hypothetical protein
LIESKWIPWLAASPDALATIQTNLTTVEIATVEVKTRVSMDRIAEAERIAQKYNMKNITCRIGDEVWVECVEAEHSTQIMIQLCVVRCFYAVYVVAQPGTNTGYGRIIYTVFGECTVEYGDEFTARYFPTLGQLLLPFYTATTTDEVVEALPNDLNKDLVNVVATRWPFFKSVREFALAIPTLGFPATSLFKTSFQTLYNCLKGGLDANTQQYNSILPKLNVTFEQKYVIRMLLSIVTNSWRAFQLLRSNIAIEQSKFTTFRTKLNKRPEKLTDFNYNLALALLRSAESKTLGNMFLDNPIIIDSSTIGKNYGEIPADLGFNRRPETLQERISDIKWPLRFRLKHFSKNSTLVELRLTHNSNFQHNIKQLTKNHGKNHCVFCYDRQTSYGCGLCNVLLCRQSKRGVSEGKSCFELWHSSLDLIKASETYKASAREETTATHSTTFKHEVRKTVKKRKENSSPAQRSISKRARATVTRTSIIPTNTTLRRSSRSTKSPDSPAQHTRSKDSSRGETEDELQATETSSIVEATETVVKEQVTVAPTTPTETTVSNAEIVSPAILSLIDQYGSDSSTDTD